MDLFYPFELADHTDWHTEHNYSPQARAVLARALHFLDRYRHRDLAFARAYTVIRPFLDAPMSLHQRLRLSYLAARARVARLEDPAALHWFNRTLDLDSQLNDTADLAALYVQRGGIHRRMLRFSRASYDHRLALAIQADDTPRSHYHDSAFRLRILSQLAIFEFYLGHYWIAQRYVEQARQLLPYVPAKSLAAATLTWIHCLLDRWAGSSWRALNEARAAAASFVDLGDASSADRITYLAAECALDIAQRLDIQRSACHRLLALAHDDLTAARKLAKGDGDQYGLELVALGQVRWSQIARRNEDRLAALDGILTRAQALNDEILIAQTYTTLGDEFALQEEQESAHTCYRAALDALEGTDSPAAGVWAWRALHIPREWDESDT